VSYTCKNLVRIRKKVYLEWSLARQKSFLKRTINKFFPIGLPSS